ncbi:MAG: hypothetical protein DHS20C18_03180 [Saprospiraceae bacterium]|nr:MAG: hypothetical protein DHS20C18_03180 [Saprospiraceae bacterium]
MANPEILYWLFQSNPSVFQLREALKAGVLQTHAVKSHRKKIKPGDKVILWQTGKLSGCYGLATVTSAVMDMAIPESESAFFSEVPKVGPRVKLEIDYNLWNRPLTRELLPPYGSMKRFYAGLPGTNYKATQRQYEILEQLVKALDSVNEPLPEYELKTWLNPPLNQILYGPPGTGKTYQTVNYALSIIENRSLAELALENRLELRRRYQEYMASGQINFVTFHQSFSYEDFIEGIKPHTGPEGLAYEIENGIFKVICEEARHCLLEAILEEQPQFQVKFKFGQLYTAFLDYIRQENFQYFITPHQSRVFLHRVQPYGNIALRVEKSYSVKTVRRDFIRQLYLNLSKWEEGKAIGGVESIVGKGNVGVYLAVLEELKKFESDYIQNLEKEASAIDASDNPTQFEVPLITESILSRCRKYVLIIDEINRANLSAVLGELITLLEPDKRDGQMEATQLILPYSKTYFSVPPNLYIVGTMNATDRSAQAMDLALRRRFAFQELLPQPTLIDQEAKVPFPAGINLAQLLTTLNRRIEQLLDSQHCIGHAYFLNVYDLDDLKAVFSQTIIPLLKEYFFNDFEKIGMILGRNFVHAIRDLNTEFADFDASYGSTFAEKTIYDLRPMEEINEIDFIRIYDKNYQI